MIAQRVRQPKCQASLLPSKRQVAKRKAYGWHAQNEVMGVVGP